MSSYIDEDVKKYIEKKSNFQNKILEFIDENGEDESKIDIYKYFDELKSQNYAFDVKKNNYFVKNYNRLSSSWK